MVNCTINKIHLVLILSSFLDTSVDWWSLGIVAYELSTGRRPYEIHSQLSNKEILSILMTPPDWPRSWPKEFLTLVSEVSK